LKINNHKHLPEYQWEKKHIRHLDFKPIHLLPLREYFGENLLPWQRSFLQRNQLFEASKQPAVNGKKIEPPIQF